MLTIDHHCSVFLAENGQLRTANQRCWTVADSNFGLQHRGAAIDLQPNGEDESAIASYTEWISRIALICGLLARGLRVLWRCGSSRKMFGRDDLLLVAKLLDLAHTWIYVHGEPAIPGPHPVRVS